MKCKYGWIAGAALLLSVPAFAQTGAITPERSSAPPPPSTRAADRTAATDRQSINDTYKADKARCDALKGNPKDVCEAEAKAKRDIARAEADAARKNDEGARRKIALTRADGEYNVAKEKCDDLKGNEKDACVKDAKANRDKARAEAKANAKVGEARREAREEQREAAKERAKDGRS